MPRRPGGAHMLLLSDSWCARRAAGALAPRASHLGSSSSRLLQSLGLARAAAAMICSPPRRASSNRSKSAAASAAPCGSTMRSPRSRGAASPAWLRCAAAACSSLRAAPASAQRKVCATALRPGLRGGRRCAGRACQARCPGCRPAGRRGWPSRRRGSTARAHVAGTTPAQAGPWQAAHTVQRVAHAAGGAAPGQRGGSCGAAGRGRPHLPTGPEA